MDLTGRQIGRLTVIGESSRKGYVVCKCECGSTTVVQASSLTRKNPTISCGCYRREVCSERGKHVILSNSAGRREVNARYGTNLDAIMRDKPRKNNKSGYTGVWFDPVRGHYYAYIYLHHKRYHLGCFKDLQDAVNAREEAEEKLFAPIRAARMAELATQ